MNKPKLQMLRPNVATLPSQGVQVAKPPGTQRVRGRALQEIRERILRRDGGICRCEDCQRTGALKEAQEVEHRVPLWAGGQEDDANRYAIASDCHKAKTAREAAERVRGRGQGAGMMHDPIAHVPITSPAPSWRAAAASAKGRRPGRGSNSSSGSVLETTWLLTQRVRRQFSTIFFTP